MSHCFGRSLFLHGARIVALQLCLGSAGVHAAAERVPALPSAQAPPPGLYDAQLCVATGAAAAQCGPVVAELGASGFIWVQIEDVVYRLQTQDDQIGVSLFHGTMQIDGFIASYRWEGTSLRFNDQEKNTRFELKVGTRRFAP